MKKLLGISLVALLAVSPMMAMADPSYAGAPANVVGEGQGANAALYAASITNVEPRYAVVDATATQDIASTSYVKGAYNAAIKAVNKVNDNLSGAIDSANNKIGTVDSSAHYINDDSTVGTNLTTLDSKVYDVTSNVGALSSEASYHYIDDESTVAGNLTALDSGLYGVDSRVVALESAVGSLDSTYASKEGVVSTINHSGTIVHTTWGADTVAFAADTVRAADANTYNKYYGTYNGTADSFTSSEVVSLDTSNNPYPVVSNN